LPLGLRKLGIVGILEINQDKTEAYVIQVRGTETTTLFYSEKIASNSSLAPGVAIKTKVHPRPRAQLSAGL
jgi:hypothetical protein